MKTADDYRKDILEALENEQTAIPGRAGETPVSNLAHKLSKLETEEIKNCIAAFRALIVNPEHTAINILENDYWRTLNFLLHHVPTENGKEELQPLFHQKLFDDSFRERKMNVWFLHGFIASGGKLNCDELGSEILREIRGYAPLAWVGSAVVSDQFNIARKNIIEFLRQGQLDVTRLLVSLFHWREVWGGIIGEEAFAGIVKEFRDAISDDEGKEKINRWLKIHKLD